MASYYEDPSQAGGTDWFDANAPAASAAQGGGTDFREAIREAYRTYLKREPSESEVSSHLNGVTTQEQLQLSLDAIRNSPEARAKAATPAAAAPTAPTDVQGTIGAILQKYPPTPQGLRDAMAEITKSYPNAKIVGSSGGDLDLSAYGVGIVDVLEGAARGGVRWHWNPDAANTSGAATDSTINPNAASYDPATFSALRTPYSEVYAPEAWAGSTPYTGPASVSVDPFVPTPYTGPASTSVAPFDYPAMTPTPNFVNPTAADLYEDPSYRVRYDEGMRALNASNSARGLMTGGTLKALEKYGQDQASKEYQNVYNRASNTWGINAAKNLAEYQTGFGSALSGWGANTGQANTEFTQGRDTWGLTNAANAAAWGLNTGQKNTEFGQARDTWGLTNDANYRDWLANYTAGNEGYKTRYGVFNDQRNFDFTNLYKLAALGAGAA